ncbi:DUF2982 domain-containing protein [Pseudoalteromonas aurantia]|uniref:DUF2982 domain-containing protein n=1 Tax=Pseudoalteromonas aurantia 208 TaxID=1314867 RepID=A0ABR9E5J7_9GAMM|nr:DUF2982 domain-containing protein [Pseudoalteromonas aurantia]MBE0366270.1 hypothetical protein [Pseudoalteromonas aurantia 208]
MQAKLRAQANQHSIEFMLVGAVCLCIIMAFVILRDSVISVVETALVSIAIFSILLGFLKSQQPYYSIVLGTQSVVYIHKFGRWKIAFDNVHSSGVPKAGEAPELLELNAVGIKLVSIDPFLLALKPRLAGKLLIEQRHIFLQAVKMHCKNGNCPSEWLIESDEYSSDSGQVYTGLIAMFANRMHNLKTLTGYDLLLPANVLDRDIWRFSYLLNRWKLDPAQVVKNLLEEQATNEQM